MTSRLLIDRWKSHCSSARNGSPFRFHAAIRKYGEETFNLEILFDNLEEKECRIIEEKLILEYNLIYNGYNANPGGCGGWIVKDENYNRWLKKVTESTFKENNGRWSGYSDEFILDECVKIFNLYENKEDFSFRDILEKMRDKFNNIPKSFSKNRFSDYQNDFKMGLSIKLNIPINELKEISNKKSNNQKKQLSKSNIGNNWYSNCKLKISKQSKIHPGDEWIQGRKYGNQN